MIAEFVSESFVLLRDLTLAPSAVAGSIRAGQWPGLIEVVPAVDTVGLCFEGLVEESRLKLLLTTLEQDPLHSSFIESPKRVQIPVLYDGPDLSTVALELGLSSSEVVDEHSTGKYECQFLGFCPGFAYLTGLPARLRGLPRLATPRPVVPPGSVAIVQEFSAVYPLERPGGWRLIGRCPLEIVNADEGFFPIAAGDQITFRQIEGDEFASLEGRRLGEV